MPTQTELGQQDMLDKEAAALLLLRRAAKNPTYEKLKRAIFLTRTNARSASTIRLLDEMFTYGTEIGAIPADTFRRVDEYRAGRIATKYVDDWTDIRDSQKANDRRAGKRATRKLSSRIETIAITENSEAYNAQREITLYSNADRLAEYVKVWDSELDKRTCPTCAGLNGTWINVDEYWPEGPPGSVHPRCRCYDSIMPQWMV